MRRRTFKFFGFNGLATLAICFLATQAAYGAVPGTLTAESYPATLTGTQLNTHKLEFTALSLWAECEVAKLAGTLASPGSSTVTLHPSYEKCKAFGLNATIDTEGCDYVAHIGETSGSGAPYIGSTDLECSGASVIQITAGIVGNKCEMQIGTQTGFNGEVVNKVGPPRDLELRANLTGLAYKVTKDEGTCPLSKVGETFKDGDYKGNSTLTGVGAGLFVSEEGTSIPGTLTAESYPATLTGTQLNTHKLEFTALSLWAECEVAKLAGTLASPGSSTVTLHPSYEKCKAFGLNATIDTEGCDYVAHIGETSGSGAPYIGSTDLECSGASVIQITAGIVGNKCEMQIGTQTGFNGEVVNKVGPPRDLELRANLTGLAYKVTKDEGTCPLSKVGETFKDGDYKGNSTLTGVGAGLFVSEEGTSIPGTLTAESYPATLTGTQLNTHFLQLTGQGLSVECEVVKLAGSLSSPGSETASLHPAYEKCHGFGFGLGVTIDAEGCDYIIHIGDAFAPGAPYRGSVDLECSGTNVMRVTGSGIAGNKCELQLGSQTGLGSIESVNAGSPKDVELKTNLVGITYKVTKDEGTCLLSGLGKTFSDGDYSGNLTLTGSSGLSVSE